MADDITADVIIVGSGISGALLASKLAAAGVKVAILEAGAEVDRGTAVQTYWDAVIKVPECPYPPTPQAMHPISNDLDSWYEQAGPDKFASTYIKVVGGTTWHWLGTCLRLVPNDFRLKIALRPGRRLADLLRRLEPFYGQAEDEIGVSGDCRRRPRRAAHQRLSDAGDPADLSRQELRQGAGGDDLRGALDAAGAATRRTRPTGRPAAAMRAASRSARSRRSTTPPSTSIARPRRARRCTSETTAVFVEVGADRKVAAIRFKRWDGSEGRATGKVFVLAAHAIETPRLLLNST